ncbi:MAG: cysteine hydrolase [Thermoleophilia bacterium]|nr:cysteine hydrolase [Thermoleophilia bacterium]
MSDWELVGKPALLLVHMQNSICKEPSPIQAMGHARAAREDGVIPNIQALKEAFRTKGHPVVFVCTYTPEDATFPAYGGFWTGSKEIVVNRMGTQDVEVIDELVPDIGEPVFYNWPFNVFYNTGLQDHLEAQGVETVVLTGVATGMSVGTAAWALAERFYNLIIPSDTCTDGNRALHDMLITAQLPAIALITTAEDVIAHL